MYEYNVQLYRVITNNIALRRPSITKCIHPSVMFVYSHNSFLHYRI